MDAEKDRHKAEHGHQKCASDFASAQHKLHLIEKDIPRSINRSRPYFDLKDNLEVRLQVRICIKDIKKRI